MLGVYLEVYSVFGYEPKQTEWGPRSRGPQTATRTSPASVPTVQFATPGAAPTALVVRAVDDGSRTISAIGLQTVLYVLNVNASGIIGQEAAREFSNTARDGPQL